MGELLWDSLPAGLFLGGAPCNVAGHLHALGVPVALVSRVGPDRLGAEAAQRLSTAGIDTSLVQSDPARPTGFVSVRLDERGVPAYDIVEPAAWDFIELRDGLRERAAQAAALVFGSLAQRNPVSRGTIEALCGAATFRVFDVNLRAPYADSHLVRQSLARADLVKLNDQELAQIAAWFALPLGLREGAAALAERFGCRTICITRGSAGAAMLHQGRWTEHPGYRVEVKDTVGAGDAFLAALLAGLLGGRSEEVALRDANLVGAYVATHFGAVPAYDPGALDAIVAEQTEASLLGRD